MTQDQQEMIVNEYNEALQSDDDKRVLRAIGHAVIASVGCQRKTSDRVKELVEKDRSLEGELEDLKHELRRLEKKVGEHDPVITEYRESKLKASGAMLLLKILALAAATGGSGVIGWLLAVVNKANGIQ